jgi:hypothetical protein
MAGDASLGIEDRAETIGGGVEDFELGLAGGKSHQVSGAQAW